LSRSAAPQAQAEALSGPRATDLLNGIRFGTESLKRPGPDVITATVARLRTDADGFQS